MITNITPLISSCNFQGEKSIYGRNLSLSSLLSLIDQLKKEGKTTGWWRFGNTTVTMRLVATPVPDKRAEQNSQGL